MRKTVTKINIFGDGDRIRFWARCSRRVREAPGRPPRNCSDQVAARVDCRESALARIRNWRGRGVARLREQGSRSGLAGAADPALHAALLFAHDRLLAERQRALRSVAFYERAFTRLESRWAGGGTQGERFRDSHHPYADDLDLVGEGSLFELLCAARTRAGEDTLAAWLLGPANPEQIQLRQGAVRELTPRLDLREDLARLGDEVRSGLHPEPVCAWGTAPATIAAKAPAAIAAGLAALGNRGPHLLAGDPGGPAAVPARAVARGRILERLPSAFSGRCPRRRAARSRPRSARAPARTPRAGVRTRLVDWSSFEPYWKRAERQLRRVSRSCGG